MPTYAYECKSCGHNWETFQGIKEESLRECPSCKKAEAKRLIGSSGFILAGGGWYQDGYSKKY